MNKYGQVEPPTYDLSKIENKMAIVYGIRDSLTNWRDVRWLLDEQKSGLKSKNVIFSKSYRLFGDFSFIIGKDMSYFKNEIMTLIADNHSNDST